MIKIETERIDFFNSIKKTFFFQTHLIHSLKANQFTQIVHLRDHIRLNAGE